MAYLFTIAFYIVIIVVPFYLCFSMESFWKKNQTIYIQPRVVFENQFLVRLETTDGVISWSSFPAYNTQLDANTARPILLTTSHRDTNHDGSPDFYRIQTSVPLLAGEKVQRAALYLFIRSNVS